MRAAIAGFEDVNLYNNNVEDLDDVDEIPEGTTTLRWKAVDLDEGYEYFVHLRLFYNGYLQDYHVSRFFTTSDDSVMGEWSFDLEGDVCNLRVYSEIWVDNPVGWQRLDYQDDYIPYSGGDDCYYHYESEFRLFSEQPDGSWLENPDSLQQGDNHVYFDTSGLNLKEGVDYWIHTKFEGEGTGNVYKTHHFYLGEGSTFDRHYNFDYSGENMHMNFTMYDWTCESSVRAYLNYYTPSGNGYRIAEYSGTRSNFDVAGCDSAGEIAFGRQADNGEWSEGYSGWEIDAGMSNLAWNLTDLDWGENYKMIFYVQVDNAYAYHNTKVEFTPFEDYANFPFPLSIDEHACYVHGWARLYIEVPDKDTGFYDGDFQEVEYTNFHADEPCIPYFDILAQDSEGEWQDTMDGYLLGNGTTSMLFDLSDLDEDDYYVEYSWSTPSGSNSSNQYVFVDGTGTDGIYWNVTMFDEDCKVSLWIALYEVDYWGNNDHVQSYSLELPGPCVLPFTLAAYQGGEWVQDPDSITVGNVAMMWNLSNLVEGQEYSFNWYYDNYFDSSGWNYTEFNHTGDDMEFTMPATQWSCTVRLYAEINLIVNDSHTRLRDQWFHVPVSDCIDGGDISLSANTPQGWDDTPPDYALDNGTTQLKWTLSDMEVGYQYSFEWIVWMNGNIVSYDYEKGTYGEDEVFLWEVYVDENVTCDIRIWGILKVDTGTGNWYRVEEMNDYFYPDCSDSAAFEPIEFEVHQPDSSLDTDRVLPAGNNTFLFDLSELDVEDGEEYRLYYHFSTTQGSYSAWNNHINTSATPSIEFTAIVTDWDCTMQLRYMMYVYTANSGEHRIGDFYYDFEGPCISDSEIELEIFDGTEWDDDPDSDDLVDGANQMIWNLTGLAIGYEYALEWNVRNNNQYVDYNYSIWNSTSEEEAVHWNLTLDEQGVCSVYVWSRLYMKDSSNGNWMEFDTADQNFYPSCDNEEQFDHVTLWAKVNGSWVQDPTWLPTGDTEMYWDTSNLIPGLDYSMYWNWNTYDLGGDQHEMFSTLGTQFNWTLSTNIWSCQADLWFYVDMISPINSHYNRIDDGNKYIATECIDVSYNWSLSPSADLTAQLDGTNWTAVNNSTVFANGSTPMELNLTDLQDQFPYFAELTAHRDGNLHFFHSDSWFADGTEDVIDWVLDLDPAACDIDISFDLYVDTADTDWTEVLTLDLSDLGGECDGSGDGPDHIFSLEAFQDGSWVSDADGDLSIAAGTTQMRWTTSSLNDGQEYYVYYSNGLYHGTGDYFENGDAIYWNLTVDDFVCEPNLHVGLVAISDMTGWNHFDHEYHQPQTPCADGGNISGHWALQDGQWTEDPDHVDPGTNQMSWNLSEIVPGYEYHLEWEVYSGFSDSWTSHWHNWTSTSENYTHLWDLDVHEAECNLWYNAQLRVNASVSGFMHVESYYWDPSEPCLPPFDMDAYLDNGTVVSDVQSLAGGTTQMYFDFAGMDPGNMYFVEYYWSTDSESVDWQSGDVNVDSSGGGLWWNITLEQHDCKAQVWVNLYDTTDGNNDWIHDYHFELDGPCIMPFELYDDIWEMASSENPGSLDVGIAYFTWDLSNLEMATTDPSLQFEWEWNSPSEHHSFSEQYDSETQGGNIFADINWNLTVGPWDCWVNVRGELSVWNEQNNTGGYWDSVMVRHYDFEVPDCYEIDMTLETLDQGQWTWHPDDGDNASVENGTNQMRWNLTGLPSEDFTLHWYVYRNGFFTDYEYQQWNPSNSDEMVYWNLSIDTSNTCELRIEASIHLLEADGWRHVEGLGEHINFPCQEEADFHLIPVSSFQNGSWIEDPESIDTGESTLRMDFSGLTNGTQYYIQTGWNADGQGGNWSEFWFDPANTTEFVFNVSAGQWDCWVHVDYQLEFTNALGWSEWAAHYSHQFATPCTEGGNVTLESYYNGEWSEVSDLQNGDNELRWNLEDMSAGYDYALEWYIEMNQNGVSDYGYELWTQSSGDRTVALDLTIDNATDCNANIWARMLVNESETDDGDSWQEVFYWGRDFWIDNGTCTYSEPVSLALDDDGNWTYGPLTLDAGVNELAWDTSNLSTGTSYHIHWWWSDGQHSDSDSIEFTADGSMIEWELTAYPWSCDVEVNMDVSIITFRGWNHHVQGGNFDLSAPCQEAESNSTQNAAIAISVLQNGSWSSLTNTTVFEDGVTQASANLTGLVEGYTYYAQFELYLDGHLTAFESEYWLASSDHYENSGDISVAGFVCSVHVSAELYMLLPDGWTPIAELDAPASGPCDGTDGEAQLSIPLRADVNSNGSWSIVDDETLLLNDVTPMQWDTSSLDDDSNYYFHFHANGQHIFDGYTQDLYGDEPFDEFWNLSLDPFSCEVEIWLEVHAVSEITGWHFMSSQHLYPDSDCIDGGDITLVQQLDGDWQDITEDGYSEMLPGTTEMQWSLTDLSTGYHYSLHWSSHANGADLEVDSHEWNSSEDEYQIAWNMTIDEYACHMGIHASLHVSDGNSGWTHVEQFDFHPSGPCEPPFSVDAYHDNGTITEDVEHLGAGTTQLFLNFSDMDPWSQIYVEYHWSTESSYGDWSGQNLTIGNGTSGVWLNITLHQTDCHAHLFVQVADNSNGWNNWWGGYDSDFTGPCESLFSLMEEGPSGAWEPSDDSLGAGTNDLLWDLSNLEMGQDYQLEWWVHSQNTYEHQVVTFTADGSDLPWTLELSHWDCFADVEAHLNEIWADNSSGNQTLHYADYEFHSFNVTPCADAELRLESSQSGVWESGQNLTDGTNDMRWNVSSVGLGYGYLLEWLVFQNGHLTDYEYFEWNPTSSDETVYWTLEVDESLTCDVEIWGGVYVWAPETWGGNNTSSWHLMDSDDLWASPSCTEPGSFGPVGVEAFQGGTWVGDPEPLDIGTNLMRLDFGDLDDGTQYHISASWNVPGNSSGYGNDSFWFDPATTPTYDFSVYVGEWDCWVEVGYELMLETFFGHSHWVGSQYREFDTNCLGGEVNLSAEQGGVWIGGDFDLVSGDNDLIWNMTDLAVGYDYALEWVASFNDDPVLYDFETWTSSSDTEAISWGIAIDDSVCDVEIQALMQVDVSPGDPTDPYTEISYFEASFDLNCTETGDFSALSLSWDDEESQNLTGGDTQMAWLVESINSDLEYSVYWDWEAIGSNGASFGSYGSATNITGGAANWTISIPDWACWVDISAHLEAGPLLDGSYVELDHLYTTLGAPCQDTTPSGNLTLYAHESGSWTEEPEYLPAGDFEMHWNLTNLDLNAEYHLEWTATMNGLTIEDESRSWTAFSDESGESWNLSVPEWYCDLEVQAMLETNTSFGWITVVDRLTWIGTPCENDPWLFVESVDVSTELFRNGTTVMLELSWTAEFNESIRDMLDAYYGDGNGYLNISESAAAADALSDNSGDDGPSLNLNDQGPDWSEGGVVAVTALPSNSFGNPGIEHLWVLYYEDMDGVNFATSFGVGDNDTEFDIHVEFHGNSDFDLDSVTAHHADGTHTQVPVSANHASYQILAGDTSPVFEVEWEEALPAPRLELLQWDPIEGDYGHPTNATSWTSDTYDFEFTIQASNLTWQNYTLAYNVWIDGDPAPAISVQINVPDWADTEETNFHVATDRYVCNLEIEVELFEDDGDLANSTYHYLSGDCTQPEFELLQWDPMEGDYGHPTNATSWTSSTYDFEFRASATDMSYHRNWSIEWDVWIDGEHDSFYSGQLSAPVWSESHDATFQVYSDRYVCDVEVETRLVDLESGYVIESTYHHLDGDCTQPELWLEQNYQDGTFGEPANVTEQMSDYLGNRFEFRISATDMSYYRNWTVEWDVWIDNEHYLEEWSEEYGSGQLDLPQWSETGEVHFYVMADMYACDVQIRTYLIDTDTGEQASSTNHVLAGDCTQASLSLEQLHADGSYGEPSNATSWTSGTYDFEFSVSAYGMDPESNWTIEWDSWADSGQQPLESGQLATTSEDETTTFHVITDQFVCTVSVEARLVNTDTGEVVDSVHHDLPGDCMQPDLTIEQNYNGAWGPPTNVTYWTSELGDYVFEFQSHAHNLSWHRNWSMHFQIDFDGYSDENMSWNESIQAGDTEHSSQFTIDSSYSVCHVGINATLLDSDTGEPFATVSLNLDGDCLEDTDQDGFHDGIDSFPDDPSEWYDSDGDGYGDNSDAFPWDSNEWLDTDGDGVGNNADDDDDGDGVSDESDLDNDGDGINDDDDAFPEDPTEWSDTDGDGYGDNSDAFPEDPTEWSDTDGDGVGDNSDDDSDGDGVPNEFDDSPLNPLVSTDSDGDGVGDEDDAFPNDKDEWADTDGDGAGDNSDIDDDGDGFIDFLDYFPLDPTEHRDSDRDGTGDNSDAFPDDPLERFDSDGDGVGDNSDAFPSDRADWVDSDGDGVGDNTDAFPTNASEYVDSDGDGVGNNADAFPYDSTETADSDGDGVGDNAQANGGVPLEPEPSGDEDDGFFGLPGFSGAMGLASLLGAAMLAGRRRGD